MAHSELSWSSKLPNIGFLLIDCSSSNNTKAVDAEHIVSLPFFSTGLTGIAGTPRRLRRRRRRRRRRLFLVRLYRTIFEGAGGRAESDYTRAL